MQCEDDLKLIIGKIVSTVTNVAFIKLKLIASTFTLIVVVVLS